MTYCAEVLRLHFQVYSLEETDLKQIDTERLENKGVVEDKPGKYKNGKEYNKNKQTTKKERRVDRSRTQGKNHRRQIQVFT